MRFMNEGNIYDAAARFREHPVLGPATQTLVNLMQWADQNSDGWVYWPKPARSAAKLMALVEGDHLDDRFDARFGEREDATPAMLTKALSPVKAFRTRQGATFEIVETLPEPVDLDDVPEYFPALAVSPEVARLLENLSTAIADDLDLLRRGKGDPLAGLEDTAAQLTRLAAGVHTGLSLT